MDKQIRSFVLRQGRLTKGQVTALDEQWPFYGLASQTGRIDYAKVFGNDNAVVLEIGFGMGASLVAQAAANQDLNYIGIEVHRPGVGHLLIEASEAQLRNIRIYHEDVIPVLKQCIPDNSLAGIQVFFPDPWPKKRHHKRRLINPSFLVDVASKLSSAGILHIATDWQPYAEEIAETVQRTGVFSQVIAPARPVTKFEARGQGLGHVITDLAYIRGN